MVTHGSARCEHGGLTSSEASAIAEALRSDVWLQELDLSGNEMCDDGASKIGAALRTNSALRELRMCSNGRCSQLWMKRRQKIG